MIASLEELRVQIHEYLCAYDQLFYGPDGERYHRMQLTPDSGQWQSATGASRKAA